MKPTNPSVRATPAEVFVSYSSRDRDRVVAVVRQLQQAGIVVWRDGDDLTGGDYYAEAIAEAIKKSKVVLLMCSESAFASNNVHREVCMTWDSAHQNILPLILEKDLKIPTRLEYYLAGTHWIEIADRPPTAWLPTLLAALAKKGVRPHIADVPPADVAPPPASPPPVVEKPAPTTVPPAKAPPEPTAPPPPPAEVPPADKGKPTRFRRGDRPIVGVDLELVEPLGVGGFGEVWKAINPLVPNMPPVALKFCLDPEAQQLLRHEAATVAQVLSHGRKHDGIVSLQHTYLSADPPCLEYEFVSGGDLTSLVSSAAPGLGTMPIANVQRIVRRLAEIVAFAHRVDPPIVHRDLKPANILIERRGTKVVLRISDFGIGGVAASRLISQTTTGSGAQEHLTAMLRGAHTPLYASPEQIAGRRADPRDDVHALGVIWYQLLVGDLTVGAPSGRRWVDPLRKRGMPPEAVDLLGSCIESQARDRPADAGVLLRRLAALDEAKLQAPPKSGPEIRRPPDQEPEPAVGRVVEPRPPTTRRPNPTGSTSRGSGSYPCLAADGTTLLKCDCGKIVRIHAAAAGAVHLCDVCGARVVVPAHWGSAADDDLPSVLPAGPPAAPLAWDSVVPDKTPSVADDRRPAPRGRRRLFGGDKEKKPGKTSGSGGVVALIVFAGLALLAAIVLFVLFAAAGPGGGIRK